LGVGGRREKKGAGESNRETTSHRTPFREQGMR
jgi:hypothetical protein